MSTHDQPPPEPAACRPLIVPGRAAGPVEDFEALLGEGSDLWADEHEFEAFLTELRQWRKRDRDQNRPQ